MDARGSSATWRTSLKNSGRRVRRGCLSRLGSAEAEGEPQNFTRPCSFNMGRGSGRDTEAGSLRMKLKGIILMCGFVRMG